MNKLINKIKDFNESVNEYFTLQNSLEYLNKFLKTFYIYSVGFDDMYYGFRNPKRLRISVVICSLLWLVTLYHLLLVTSDDVYSLINGPFLPELFKVLLLFNFIVLFLITAIKTEIIFGEVKCNTEPFKVFHFLMRNVKSKHKLTEKNYKKLAILSRIVQICLLNYVIPIVSGIIISLYGLIAIKSGQIFWLFEFVLITPFYIEIVLVITTFACTTYVYYAYYMLLFNQINDRFKFLMKNNNKSKIICQKKEIKLLHLIHEHNLAAIEIDNMNSIIKRSDATMFITFSLIKNITLYLFINAKDTFLNLLMGNAFIAFFIFGFGASIMFSLQIKSAHKSQRLIHSILCKYKMRLSFRLQVIQINFY